MFSAPAATQAFHQAVLEGVAGDPLVCGVAVENELFNQNGGVTAVRIGRWDVLWLDVACKWCPAGKQHKEAVPPGLQM